MFAVISDGSRRYRVQEGDKLLVDYREGAENGRLAFRAGSLANAGGPSAVGLPAISGALVEATVVNPEVKGKKLEIGKLRRRKNFRRHTGHRQKYRRKSKSPRSPCRDLKSSKRKPKKSRLRKSKRRRSPPRRRGCGKPQGRSETVGQESKAGRLNGCSERKLRRERTLFGTDLRRHVIAPQGGDHRLDVILTRGGPLRRHTGRCERIRSPAACSAWACKR